MSASLEQGALGAESSTADLIERLDAWSRNDPDPIYFFEGDAAPFSAMQADCADAAEQLRALSASAPASGAERMTAGESRPHPFALTGRPSDDMLYVTLEWLKQTNDSADNLGLQLKARAADYAVRSLLIAPATPPGVPGSVRALSEAATLGEWYTESEKCDGSYGSGEDCGEGYFAYSILTDAEPRYGNPGVIADTINSTLGVIHEESHEDGFTAWDETARANTAFIVAAVNHVRALIAARPAGQAGDTGADARTALTEACKPWEHYTGEPPDDGSPLSGVFVAGMVYTERLLAKLLGVAHYEGGDGSEDFDSDATQTLRNILTGAGLWDADENRPVSATPAQPAGAVPDGLRETLHRARGFVAAFRGTDHDLFKEIDTLLATHPAGQSAGSGADIIAVTLEEFQRHHGYHKREIEELLTDFGKLLLSKVGPLPEALNAAFAAARLSDRIAKTHADRATAAEAALVNLQPAPDSTRTGDEGVKPGRVITGGQVRRAMELVGFDKLKIEPSERTISEELTEARDLRRTVKELRVMLRTALNRIAELEGGSDQLPASSGTGSLPEEVYRALLLVYEGVEDIERIAAYAREYAAYLIRTSETGGQDQPPASSGKALTGKAQGAWLPISTAPKDGTEIWAWLYDSGVRKLRWWSAEEICEEEGRNTPDAYQAGFYEVADRTEWWNPAWWVPADRLPAPPASSDQGER